MTRPVLAPVLLIASILAGLTYPLLWNAAMPAAALIAAKGAGVGLLALHAAVRAQTRDGWLLAAIMALGAVGDVLLDIRFEAGAAAFAVGHAVAIWLYLRNRRAVITRSQRALAVLLPLFGMTMPTLLLGRFDPGLTVYAVLLTAMAATAWTSRFPRYRTGIGALMFVVSDALIVGRMGPLADMAGISLAIWLLYYLGQLLIALGVTRTLARQ